MSRNTSRNTSRNLNVTHSNAARRRSPQRARRLSVGLSLVLTLGLPIGGLILAGAPAAADVGDEVEISSGVVTAMSCAVAARKSGKLEVLSSCPLSETASGLVVFDVAEKTFYRLARKKVCLYQLEAAYGGGSIDLSGIVVDYQDGVPVVEVQEFAVVNRPKAGSFKGCI